MLSSLSIMEMSFCDPDLLAFVAEKDAMAAYMLLSSFSLILESP